MGSSAAPGAARHRRAAAEDRRLLPRRRRAGAADRRYAAVDRHRGTARFGLESPAADDGRAAATRQGGPRRRRAAGPVPLAAGAGALVSAVLSAASGRPHSKSPQAQAAVRSRGGRRRAGTDQPGTRPSLSFDLPALIHRKSKTKGELY